MEKLAFFTAAAAVLCIAGLAFFARASDPLKVRIEEIDEGLEGKLVAISGRIMSVDARGGNYFFSLCSSECVRVVVFAKTAEAMASRNLDLASLGRGSRVSLVGVVRHSAYGPSVVAITANSLEVNS